MNETQPPITYRLCLEGDFPALAAFYEELDEFFRTLEYRLPKPENAGQAWIDSFRRTLGRFSQVHIAEMNGEIVGFMLSRIKRTPIYFGGVLVGELSDMIILPQARRRGVGERLSRMGIEWMLAQGAHSIEIQVLESNMPSWKLYEGLGFQPEFRAARLLAEEYQPEEE